MAKVQEATLGWQGIVVHAVVALAFTASHVSGSVCPDTRTEGGPILALAIDPANATTLYAGSGNAAGIFKSTDGGASWTHPAGGLPRSNVRALAIDLATFPATVFAGTAYGGMYRSTDGGATWLPANNGIVPQTTPPRYPGFGADVTVDGTTVYAAVDAGTRDVFASTNGGTSWQPTHVPEPIGRVDGPYAAGSTNNGIYLRVPSGWVSSVVNITPGEPLLSIALDHLTPAVYVGTLFEGVWRSTTSFFQWNHVSTGLTDTEVPALVTDPTDANTLYAGTASSGVFKTTDYAATWAPMNAGLTNLAIHALAMAPTNHDIVYAGTNDGIFKTVDGGLSWSAINTGLLNVGTAAGPVTQPQLRLTHLATPVGDDGLVFKGNVLEALSGSPVDPLTNGIRLVVSDAVSTVLDVTIPGGAFADPPGVGWKANGSFTKWTFVDKTAAPAGGISKVAVGTKPSKAPGVFSVSAKGRNGSYPTSPANLPLSATVVLAPPTDQCGDAVFPGPAPTPSCAFNGNGSTVTCK